MTRSRADNPYCKRSSLNVGFAPKAAELRIAAKWA